MNTDRLLRLKSQPQSVRGTDLLLGENAHLDSLLTAYLVACKTEGKSPATLSIYYDVIHTFIRFLRDNCLPLEAAAVQATHVRLFLLGIMERNVTPETVNAYYRGVNTFFNWLVREGHLKESPFINIKPPRIPEKIIQPYTPDDIKRLLLLCSGTRFVDIRNRAIILTFLDTGLRLFELANIKLEDIDFSKETIKVMGKGSKERIVPIGRIVQQMLRRYIQHLPPGTIYLWLAVGKDKHLTRNGIEIEIRRLCRRAKIPGKHGCHRFRHTAAINYLRNGGDQFTLQVMLGHSHLDMTRRYTKALSHEDVSRIHKKASPVDNLFGGK